MNEVAPTRIPWPPILLAAAIATGWFAQRVVPIDWPPLDGPASFSAGVALLTLAFATVAWAALEMRRARTTILPHVGATTLVTGGPFLFSRNPIYIADCIGLAGLALALRMPWIGLLIPAFVVLVTRLAIEPEERHLETRFGKAYADYRLRTRRWL